MQNLDSMTACFGKMLHIFTVLCAMMYDNAGSEPEWQRHSRNFGSSKFTMHGCNNDNIRGTSKSAMRVLGAHYADHL